MIDISKAQSYGSIVTFQKGDTPFSQNDAGEDMYVVLNGKFGLYINSRSGDPVKHISAGGFFGEQSVIDGGTRGETAAAEERSMAFKISRGKFMTMIKSENDIAREILVSLTERVKTDIQVLRDSGTETADSEFSDSGDVFADMLSLCGRLRELDNMILRTKEKPKCVSKITSILPDGHPELNATDTNNSREYLRMTNLGCPNCGHKFTGFTPASSKLTVKEIRPDQRVKYNGFDILWYTNCICPNCNYSHSYPEFMKFKKKSDDAEEHRGEFANTEGFTGFPPERTLGDVIKSYYLNVECLLQTSPISHISLANAWHKLYWLYSENDYDELARKAALESLIAYTSHLEVQENLIEPGEHMNIYAVCGDFCSFLGDTAQAVKYYTSAVYIGNNINLGFSHQTVYKHCLKREEELMRAV